MSNGIMTELRVPDLWYDFYARMVPGAAFVAALRLIVLQKSTLPEVREIILLASAGYFCALITQPVASRITGWIEDVVEGRNAPDGDRLYIRKVKNRLGRTSRESMILSKMHGEVAFFIQLALLSTVFLVIQFYRSSSVPIWIILVVVIVFFILAREVALRRLKRAIDYDNSIVSSDHGPLASQLTTDSS